MATNTENLKLSKAETSDAIKSTLIANNQNFDKLDGVITRLKNNQLQGTASGTEIILTDAGEVESVLHISGNSEQDSRSGKNLFDMVNGVLGDCTKTIDGNSITLTSTLEAGGFSAYTFTTPAKPNTSYYIKSKSTRTGNGGGGIIIQTRNSNNEMISSLVDQRNILNTEKTFTTSADTYYLKIYLYACGATDIANASATYTEVQLEEGSTATSYEPYGVQPSPDYPSEIRSVKSKSDNLFDISKKKDNTTFVWTNGIEGANEGCILSDYIDISSIKSLSSNYKFHIAFYNSSKTYLGNGVDVTKVYHEPSLDIEIPKNSGIAYCRVAWKPTSIVPSNPADMTTITNIMLNKDTVALPYQPYGYVPVEVKVEGKNLVSETEHAFISSAGVVTLGDGNIMSGFIEVENGASYILSGYYPEFVRMQRPWQIAFYDSNYNFISRQIGIAYNVAFTISGENIKYIRAWTDRGSTSDPIPAYLQVEKGTMVTPYEPYKTKTISLPLGDIELRSTPGGTRDTFARVDGVWNLVNKIGSIIYDGVDEAWAFGTKSGDSSAFRVYISNSTFAHTKIANVRSNKFIGRTYDGLWTDMGKGFYIALSNGTSGGNNRLFATTDYSKVPITNETEWKTWLKSNPITVEYLLATPTYTPITDQGLISALDELEELILHKGYNYITATAVNGVKAHLDLSYYKDINIVLDNINASILSLGGGANV